MGNAALRIVQFYRPDQGRRVGIVDGETVFDVTSARPEWRRVVDVAEAALQRGSSLEQMLNDVRESGDCQTLDYDALLNTDVDRATISPPVNHADEHRILITGTGLTHTGGMKSRDQMHGDGAASENDSVRMFQMGVEGGKPEAGHRGAAPEWFYKGDGFNLRGRGQTLEIPRFTTDGGEEPEIAVVYLIDEERTPRRLGFCLGNEWSDHPLEKINYLYLAPSKLRTCALGPELITDLDFAEVELNCRVMRGDEILYDSGPLLSGENHMCHSLVNCEDHHFKYAQHRRPGDVHIHFLGTSKLSYGERDWTYEDGDVITIRSPQMGASLVNPVARRIPDNRPVTVRKL